MPTRYWHNAMAFTDAGPIRLRNLQYERDPRPLEEGCPCPACRRSRAYIRHLFMAGEMLGPILLSIHNLTYYQRLLAGRGRQSSPTSLRPIKGRRFGAGRHCRVGGPAQKSATRRESYGPVVPLSFRQTTDGRSRPFDLP